MTTDKQDPSAPPPLSPPSPSTLSTMAPIVYPLSPLKLLRAGSPKAAYTLFKDTLTSPKVHIDTSVCRKSPYVQSTLPFLSFVRGPGCSKCSERAYFIAKATSGNEHPAIRGLNATWITPQILACNRPFSHIISKYNIIAQFKKLNVTAIVNLSMPGEHPFCGSSTGLHPNSGLSYDASEFTNSGIGSYNFGWVDMTVPSFERMVSVCCVCLSHIERGENVAVHCHAGFGRTGLVIACTLLLQSPTLIASDAIRIVRSKRPGSIETFRQERFVVEFWELIRDLRVVFVEDVDDNEKKDGDGVGGGGGDGDGNDDGYGNGEVSESQSKVRGLKRLEKLKQLNPYTKTSAARKLAVGLGQERSLAFVSDSSFRNRRRDKGDGDGDDRRINIKEAITRQFILAHQSDNNASSSSSSYTNTNVPKLIHSCVDLLMRHAKCNSVSVACSIAGVSESGWPGRGKERGWDDAFLRVYGGDSEGGDGEEKKYSNDDVSGSVRARVGVKEPVLHPPKWNVNDEETLASIKSSINKDGWAFFEQSLEEINATSTSTSTSNSSSDDDGDDNHNDGRNEPQRPLPTFDPRPTSQLLLDYLSQLSEPLIPLDAMLIRCYDTDVDLDIDIDVGDFTDRMPPLSVESSSKSRKSSRWSIRRATLFNSLKTLNKSKSLTPSQASALYLSLVTCAYTRHTVDTLLRLLAKSKFGTPDATWKKACVRMGVALTGYHDSVGGGGKERWRGVVVGRDLINFEVDGNGYGNGYDENRKKSKREDRNNRKEFNSNVEEVKINDAKTMVEYALLLGRFVECLTEIYTSPSTFHTSNSTSSSSLSSSSEPSSNGTFTIPVVKSPASIVCTNRLIRATGYLDIQSCTYVVLRGFEGEWNSSITITSVGGGGDEGIGDRPNRAEIKDRIKRGVVAYYPVRSIEVLDYSMLTHSNYASNSNDAETDTTSPSTSVNNKFTLENVESIQLNGGCENLFLTHMKGVNAEGNLRVKAEVELEFRVGYLTGLVGLKRRSETSERDRIGRGKGKGKMKPGRRVKVPVEVDDGDAGDGEDGVNDITNKLSQVGVEEPSRPINSSEKGGGKWGTPLKNRLKE